MQEHCVLKQKRVAFDTTRKLIAILISKEKEKEVEKKNFEHRNSFWFLFSCRRHSLKAFTATEKERYPIPHSYAITKSRNPKKSRLDTTFIRQQQRSTTLSLVRANV